MNAGVDANDDGRLAIPLVLHFDGDVPGEGLNADEVASVADGMAKAVQFLTERASDSDRVHTLHLTAVRPGSATFQFLLEIGAVTQSVLPTILGSEFSIKHVGELFSQTLKLLEFLKGKPPQATARIEGSHNVQVPTRRAPRSSFTRPSTPSLEMHISKNKLVRLCARCESGPGRL
jgi:hypothetical protein